jgi:hypothetical protein
MAQLTQSISQFAMQPVDEEIKKTGWWQFWSWVKVTEKYHKNRKHWVHFSSKDSIHHLAGLFNGSRTRPQFWK